jgi:hypothetical protein
MKAWTLGGVIVGAMMAALTVACTDGKGTDTHTDGFPDERGIGDQTAVGSSASMCTIDDTADAGLAPIGPNGCAVGTVIVYRNALSAGGGGSAVGSAAEASSSSSSSATTDGADASDGGVGFAPMIPACAPLSCKPGQVGVVTWGSAPGSSPGPPTLADAAVDSSATGDGDASASGGDAAADGGTSDDGGTATLADGGGAGGDAATVTVPLPQCLGFVIKCIDAPPSCPSGKAPSFAPSGKWHCVPLCNPNDPDMVVISYGGQFGSTRVCAGAPPKDACADPGAVWTWDYTDEEWVCRPKCDNGMYDQHQWGGQTVCVPC